MFFYNLILLLFLTTLDYTLKCQNSASALDFVDYPNPTGDLYIAESEKVNNYQKGEMRSNSFGRSGAESLGVDYPNPTGGLTGIKYPQSPDDPDSTRELNGGGSGGMSQYSTVKKPEDIRSPRNKNVFLRNRVVKAVCSSLTSFIQTGSIPPPIKSPLDLEITCGWWKSLECHETNRCGFKWMSCQEVTQGFQGDLNYRNSVVNESDSNSFGDRNANDEQNLNFEQSDQNSVPEVEIETNKESPLVSHIGSNQDQGSNSHKMSISEEDEESELNLRDPTPEELVLVRKHNEKLTALEFKPEEQVYMPNENQEKK